MGLALDLNFGFEQINNSNNKNKNCKSTYDEHAFQEQEEAALHFEIVVLESAYYCTSNECIPSIF